MRHALLSILLVLAACTAQDGASREPSAPPLQTVDPTSGDRICNGMGGFRDLVCTYRLDEVPGIARESAILVRGYLHRDEEGFYITSERDGSGDRLRANLDDAESPAFANALLGYLVGIRGIYTPTTGVVAARRLGYYEEPGVPRPDLPRDLEQ